MEEKIKKFLKNNMTEFSQDIDIERHIEKTTFII